MRWTTYILFFIGYSVFPQTVAIDTTSYSKSELVDLLLDDSCVEVSNISISSPQSVAYFDNGGGAFPIEEGIVIRSGKAAYCEGAYTGLNMTSQLNTNSDAYLSDLNAASGQTSVITDVAFLEFDFVPISNNFNFDFLFASNEYGQWQCLSSDIFAFLLIDPSMTDPINLAVLPNSNLPVSVRNIKDNLYNTGCDSDNPGFFASYEVSNPASTINMRGYTVTLNASSEIIPGNSYTIRMVIGDSDDEEYDSAIFLAAGSFVTDVDLGPDRTMCDGDTFTLETGLTSPLYTHAWTRNGMPIPGETDSDLVISQSGLYSVTVQKSGTTCVFSDEIEIFDLQVHSPDDLTLCYDANSNYAYNLTINDEGNLGINPVVYDLEYYASMTDLTAGTAIPTSMLTAYPGVVNQSIYIKILNTQTGQTCDAVYEFDLLVYPEIPVGIPDPIIICEDDAGMSVMLTLHNSQIADVDEYDFFFFESESAAQYDGNSIDDPTSYPLPPGMSSFSVWVRVEDPQTPQCFAIVELEINIAPPPPVDQLDDVIACTEYVVPPIVNGNVYEDVDGGGEMFGSGDIIEEGGDYYVFNGPDENGCTSQTTFEVTFADEYSIDTLYCEQWIVPTPPTGNFYTAPGGPDGPGSIIWPETILTTSQTVYFYAEFEGVPCCDDPYNIQILSPDPVDEFDDIVTCFPYELPPLTEGQEYYTAIPPPSLEPAPKVITATDTLYVVNASGECWNSSEFIVSIIDMEDVFSCGPYVLPPLDIGGYYGQPYGGGQEIPAGTVITSTQTIYFYAQTTEMPNCTNTMSFVVDVFNYPEVPELPDVMLCGDEIFMLPEIDVGDYFTVPDRVGPQLFPGDTIDYETPIYINSLVNGCEDQSMFEVTQRPLPEVENFTDVYSCEPFELPPLEHGSYYTHTGGSGAMLQAGDMIYETQALYVYNEWEDFTACYNETSFTVFIQGVDVGEFEDVSACDEYILPHLQVGGYYTKQGGKGSQFFPGDTIKTEQKIYVYAENGERFPCTSENSFFVKLTETPILPDYPPVEICELYTLPELSQEDYNMGYYYKSGGEDPIPSYEYVFTPGNYIIYVYATAKDNPVCFAEEKFELTVYPLLSLEIKNGTICLDTETGEVISPAFLTSGLDPDEFTVNWHLNDSLVHSGPNYTVTKEGTYLVKTIKLTPEVGPDCNYAPAKVNVFESAKPIIRAKMTAPFSEIAVITVEVLNGVGKYEFRLDNGDFQDSNEFYDVSSGTHTIRARGLHGNCGWTELVIEVFHYPKFFTPNNDGFNDRWNIPDLKNHREAEIFIFDRYGKLLTCIAPRGIGWDGNYNGKAMPSDDYWFKVVFELDGEKKVFKSHFSLIR